MSFSIYDAKPWLSSYADHTFMDDEAPESVCHAYLANLKQDRRSIQLQYFDDKWSRERLADDVTRFAGFLVANGFSQGDRIVFFGQDDPACIIALLAVWRLRGVFVPVNPMSKSRDLLHILKDANVKVTLSLDTLDQKILAPIIVEHSFHVSIRIVYSAFNSQTQNNKHVLTDTACENLSNSVTRLSDVIGTFQKDGFSNFPFGAPKGEDIAVLAYTSGTTGEPKGAALTHANMMANALLFKNWVGLDPSDINLCIAPLFHITGLVAHAVTSLVVGCQLIITHRFHPETIINTIRLTRPTYTIGAITAFISLMNSGSLRPGDFDSFKMIQSGGAPVSAALVDEFQRLTGHYIYNAYGMTESSSASLMVPKGTVAPVDPNSGALSIGVPGYHTMVRVLRSDGSAADITEIGELVKTGPQVMKGYWNRDGATQEVFVDGYLRTGDVGFMDENGWFYLVDRKKDMISVSGYKVWPRDVEDVLYEHPAVREVAVIGVSDAYRGETVKAFVVLKTGVTVTAKELIEFARGRMASYKYPRVVEIVEGLPKTNTGKILRRALK